MNQSSRLAKWFVAECQLTAAGLNDALVHEGAAYVFVKPAASGWASTMQSAKLILVEAVAEAPDLRHRLRKSSRGIDMKRWDYEFGGTGTIRTFTPRSDRAKERTPETLTFEDAAKALEFMKAAQAEGYMFAEANRVDPEQKLERVLHHRRRWAACSSGPRLGTS